MILPIWLFVLLVVLAAYGLFMLAASSDWKVQVLVLVDCFFISIGRTIKKAAADERAYGLVDALFGSARKKKKRVSRKPKGHPKTKKRRRR